MERSFQVLFIDDADIPEVVWRGMKGGSEVGEGAGVESNLPSRRGWTRSYFNFKSGGVQLYFKAYFANLRTPPPLQIIIAQSLSFSSHQRAKVGTCGTSVTSRALPS